MAEKDTPKVTVHVNLKLPGPQQYSMIEVGAMFAGLDVNATKEALSAQLDACAATTLTALPKVEEVVAQGIADASGMAVEGSGLRRQFASFEDFVNKRLQQIVEEVKRQREVIDAKENDKKLKTDE